jgi:hypothetical protein
MRHAPSGWLTAGSAFTAVVVGIGAVAVAAALAQRTTEDARTHRGPVDRIVVDLSDGRLTVRRGGPEVVVHRRLAWSWTRPHTTQTWADGTLTLAAACGTRSRPSVAVNCTTDYTLEVPAQVHVTARTSEDIRVDGVRGDLDLSTAGTVTVTGAAGRVAATSPDGDIDVRFDRPPPEAEASTESGDIRLVVPRDGRYRVHTVVPPGDEADVAVAREPDGPHRLTARTGTGTVAIAYL